MTAETFRLILAICAAILTLGIVSSVSPTMTVFVVLFAFAALVVWLG